MSFVPPHKENSGCKSSREGNRGCSCSGLQLVEAPMDGFESVGVACMHLDCIRSLARNHNHNNIHIVVVEVVEVEAVDMVSALVPVEAAMGALENVILQCY